MKLRYLWTLIAVMLVVAATAIAQDDGPPGDREPPPGARGRGRFSDQDDDRAPPPRGPRGRFGDEDAPPRGRPPGEGPPRGGGGRFGDDEGDPNGPRPFNIPVPPPGEGGQHDVFIRRIGPGGPERMEIRAFPFQHDPKQLEFDMKEVELETRARKLVEQHRAADGDSSRKKLRDELLTLVSEQFELRQKRRAYELERLEENLKRLREAIEKRTEARETLIRQRVGQLLQDESDIGF